MQKLITYLLLLTCVFQINGTAPQGTFAPLASNKQLEKNYLDLLKENYKEAKKQVDDKHKKILLDFYDLRYESSVKRVEYGHFLLQETIDNYLAGIKDAIAEANPDYDLSKVKFLVSRYTWPNAFSVGDGTIAINMGLFEHFDNESELIFILCHELGHYLLNHSDKKYIQRFTQYNNEEFKEKLKRIRKDEYYQATRLKALLKVNIYSERKHSREYEYEADSLGLELYLKTGFKFDAVESVFVTLDRLNDITSNDGLNVYEILDIDSVEYGTAALKINNETDDDKLDNDLVATHPECQQRIEALRKQHISSNAEAIIEQEKFRVVKDLMVTDLVHSYINFNELDKALIRLLKRVKLGYNDKYTYSSIIVVMEKLVTARSNHYIGRVVTLPNAYQSKASNDMSSILYGMRYKTLCDAFYKYAWNIYYQSYQDEETMYSMAKLAKLANVEDTYNGLATDFIMAYPKSRYAEELKNWFR